MFNVSTTIWLFWSPGETLLYPLSSGVYHIACVSPVNYRGSTGFGQDSILSLIGHIGSQDVKDVQVPAGVFPRTVKDRAYLWYQSNISHKYLKSSSRLTIIVWVTSLDADDALDPIHKISNESMCHPNIRFRGVVAGGKGDLSIIGLSKWCEKVQGGGSLARIDS